MTVQPDMELYLLSEECLSQQQSPHPDIIYISVISLNGLNSILIDTFSTIHPWPNSIICNPTNSKMSLHQPFSALECKPSNPENTLPSVNPPPHCWVVKYSLWFSLKFECGSIYTILLLMFEFPSHRLLQPFLLQLSAQIFPTAVWCLTIQTVIIELEKPYHTFPQ